MSQTFSTIIILQVSDQFYQFYQLNLQIYLINTDYFLYLLLYLDNF